MIGSREDMQNIKRRKMKVKLESPETFVNTPKTKV